MARVRWVNGNQIAYGAGSWFRYVLDVDTPGDGGISVWWGVETLYSISDSTNAGDSYASAGAGLINHANTNYSHGAGGGVTWLRGEGFWITPGSTINFSGYVANLASVSGASSVSASWTRPALPPNQLANPVITDVTSTTMTGHFADNGTNGTPTTSYDVEWHYSDGSGLYYATTVPSSPVYGAGLTPNRGYALRVRANSAAGSSPWSGFTYWTQAVAIPIAPTGLTVTRTSDTSHSLAWTRGSQTQGPYASQEILRSVLVNNAWQPATVIASLSGSATSYVDTTTVANKAYSYYVRATNASGVGTSASSLTVWTTPGVPTSQSAAKDASSNIVVTWAAPASAPGPNWLKYEVSESTDGGTVWSVLTTTAAGALSYTHTAPNASVPHMYRVRAIVSTTGEVGSGLASAYAVTNTVQLLTPPNAPTNLQNTPAGTADRAQTILLTWQHNPLDSTPQTKYTLQHRLAGTTPWTTVGPTTTAVSSYTLPANTYPTGSAFEWQVMTWGLHATGSPYSAIATTQISSTPGVSISSPAEASVVGGTSLTVNWTFSDPDSDPQGSWEATLYGPDGATLETRSGATTATTTTFAYRLADATAYSVKVRVRDSRGLWSTLDTRNFTVAYPLPPTPVILGSIWDWKRATVELNISVPAPSGGQVAPIYLEVWRSIDDGPYELLVTNLPPLTVSYLDWTPTVAGKNSYVVVAVSDLPSLAQSLTTTPEATVTTPESGDGRPAVWLSGGTNFTQVGRLATEVSVDAGRLRERVLQRYAGRPLPVEHSGEHVAETWQVEGLLNLRWSQDVDLPESPEGWLALGALAGPFLLRAPALFGGQTIYTYVSIDGPTLARQVGGNVQKVSFTATRTEG